MRIKFWNNYEPVAGVDYPTEEDENATSQIHDEMEFNKVNKPLDTKVVKAAEELIERLSEDDTHKILNKAWKKESLMNELKFIDKREGK
jgi:hypothetical protein